MNKPSEALTRSGDIMLVSRAFAALTETEIVERILPIMRRNDEATHLVLTWPQTIVTDDEDEQ